MPWEKSFDEDAAVTDAMKVFWEKGFEPTSITDLLAGTGINKGSLYNAFGGKQQLFLRTLQKYDQERQAMLARLEALDDPQKAITSFFDNIVTETVADENHKGCFLLNTALQINSHNAEVNSLVSTGIKETVGFFRRSIEVGQARGEMPAELNPETTAKALMGLIAGIRVLGRGVFAEDSLRAIANEGKRMIAM